MEKKFQNKQIIKKSNETPHQDKKKYVMPCEQAFIPKVEKYFECPPNTKSWIHGEQKDDIMTETTHNRTRIINKLKKIIVPEQRTTEWFKQRDGMITASDGGTAIGMSKYEQQYTVILKKLIDVPFTGAKACYHGKKYEHIATMIYQYRMNALVHEYGLIQHPTHKFIGASPDGIVDIFKYDGIHKTNLVGRMLEIKVPESRQINMTSSDIFDVCPIHYYVQVQLQLECCDLDDCDFWQCEIDEYKTKEKFIDDTDASEPFRSMSSGYEKGCLIQFLPLCYTEQKNMNEIIYNQSKFLYPPKIEMSPYECDRWIADTISNYRNDDALKNYAVDRVIYWRLTKSRCITIPRDRKWFSKNLPIFENMWKYISFLRKNKRQRDIFLAYVNLKEKQLRKSELNDVIMACVKMLCNQDHKNYDKFLRNLENEISSLEQNHVETDICGLESDYIIL